jgi:hypothetical protein
LEYCNSHFWQWLQMLLYELPSLQAAVAWRPGRLVLGGAGAYLMAGSALYVINRIADGMSEWPL